MNAKGYLSGTGAAVFSFFDDCIQPHGSARIPHHRGGVAHETSLRSRSIMMWYTSSPPCGEVSAAVLTRDHPAVTGHLVAGGEATRVP